MHVYTLSGTALTELKTLTHGGAVTDVGYSPDGTYFAACDTYRKVILYDLPDYKVSRRTALLIVTRA